MESLHRIECQFECPLCSNVFSKASEVETHMKSSHEQTSHSMISEANSSSWKYVECSLCKMIFQNEYDLNYHLERFHEYGESCEIYPCEECAYRGQDMGSLNEHIGSFHGQKTEALVEENITFEQIGIEKIPIISKRR